MATATANGLAVLTTEIVEPLRGVWHADIEQAGGEALSGSVTLSIGSVEWVGTVLPGHSGVDGGRVKTRIVGGAGGLGTELDAKYYRGASVADLLADLLRETGETLSDDAEDLSTHVLARWSRTQGTGGQALAALLERVGYAWRIERDGSLWIGTDSWPTLSVEQTELEAYAEDDAKLYSPLGDPLVRPGVTVDGRHVSSVTTLLSPSSLRQEVWFGDQGDPLQAGLEALAKIAVGRKVDYLALHPSTVVGQNAAGQLELLPDNVALRGQGLTEVTIRHGLPGCTVKVPVGTRVLLGFESGNPDLPYAALWEAGSVTEIVFDGGTKAVARVDDSIDVGTITAIDALAAPVTFIYTPPGGTPQTPTQTLLLDDGKITGGNSKLKA